MTETKKYKRTGFSRPSVITYSDYATVNNGTPERFQFDEWDMELIFTRKPRPIEVGSEVRRVFGTERGTVSALCRQTGASEQTWAWVRFSETLPPSSILIKNLRHADTDADDD